MSKIKLKPCPFCGGKPELTRAGDNKQFYVYFCSQCCKTPVKYSEARLTEWAARRSWNKRAENETD